MSSSSDVTYLGETNHRASARPFGIRQVDRRSHLYVIGKTGTGKSRLLRNIILQDIEAGRGCALFDPHGDLVRDLIALLPKERRADLIYFDATDPDLTWRFNPLAGISPEYHAFATAGFVEVLKRLWPDEWGPRLEHLVRNVVLTLLEDETPSLRTIPALLADRDYRKEVVRDLSADVVREFWVNEYERYSPAFRAVVAAPLQNKIGALLTDPGLRRILTEEGTQIDLRRIMDDGKILLVNLDKGILGEGPSALLGSFLLSHIALAGMSRSRVAESERRDFSVVLDEFQTFTTLSIATMLSELRKYRVGLTLAHQHLAQLETEIRDAVFGNVGSILAFRVGAQDAAFVAREFMPRFEVEDLVNLPRFHAYLKLLIDGSVSQPFSMTTIPEPPKCGAA
jgi:hypothetical protein